MHFAEMTCVLWWCKEQTLDNESLLLLCSTSRDNEKSVPKEMPVEVKKWAQTLVW